MRQLLELKADEPIDRLRAEGVAAIVSSEEEDWSIGLEPLACRILAEKLLALAEGHERQFGQAARS